MRLVWATAQTSQLSQPGGVMTHAKNHGFSQSKFPLLSWRSQTDCATNAAGGDDLRPRWVIVARIAGIWVCPDTAC